MPNTVTLRTIAEECGCSRTTVSLALRGDKRITETVRKQIVEVAEHRGYKRSTELSLAMSHIATQNAMKGSMPVGLFYDWEEQKPWQRNDRLALLHTALKKEAKKAGYVLSEFWLNDYKNRNERINDVLEARGMSAVIGFVSETTLYSFPIDTSRFVSVVIGSGYINPQCITIDHDFYSATLEMLMRLYEAGYRRLGICFVGNTSLRTGQRIEAAFSHFHYSKKLEPHPSYFHLEKPVGTKELLAWIANEKLEVVISAADLFPWFDKHVPQIHEGSLGFCSFGWDSNQPHVSGIDIQREEIAKKAISFLDTSLRQRLSGKKTDSLKVLLPGKWVAGNTVPLLRA